MTKGDEPDTILCPFCSRDLTNSAIYEREAHADACAENSIVIDLEEETLEHESIIRNTKNLDVIPKLETLQELKDPEILKISQDDEEPLVELDKLESCSPVPLSDKTDRRKGPRLSKRTRPLPEFKIVPFTDHKIVVDGFNFASHPEVDQYFLSHFHGDHYTGMHKYWDQGHLFGSLITCKLALHRFSGVEPEKVHILPLHEEMEIHDNITVYAVDANHCPGALIFIFTEYSAEKDNTSGDKDGHHLKRKVLRRIVHTGDFRSSSLVIKELLEVSTYFDTIYLDTTYQGTQRGTEFEFPLQEHVISECAELARMLQQDSRGKSRKGQRAITDFHRVTTTNSSFAARQPLLVVCGSYALGKERIALAIAEALGTMIYDARAKSGSLRKVIWDDLAYEVPLKYDPKDCAVHMVPMKVVSSNETLKQYSRKMKTAQRFDYTLGLAPTGWAWSSNREVSAKQYYDQCMKRAWAPTVLRVPYSEHSSASELQEFVAQIPHSEVISTVR